MTKPKAKLRQRAKRGQPEPYQRSDGRWAVTLDLGRRPDGQRWKLPVYGPSPEAVRDAIPSARARATAASNPYGPETTVAAWTAHWIETIAPRWDKDGRRTGIKHSSWRGYEKHGRLSIDPSLLGRTRIGFVTPRMVREWTTYLGSPARGLGPRSVKYALDTLKLAMKEARIEGIIKDNPADGIKPPSQTLYEAQILNLEESRRFLRAIRGHEDEALILVSLFGGPRQGETLALRRTDINLDTGVVRFAHTLDWIEGEASVEENKTRKSLRSIQMPSYVLDVVRRHLDELDERPRPAGFVDYGLLFPGEKGQPVRGSVIYRRLHKILSTHGLPVLRWHDLRHSAASLMLALGLSLADIQQIMGWSSLEMLSRRYGHIIPELAADKLAKLQAALVDFEGAQA